MIEMLELSPADEELIRNPDFCGGSTIVGPDSRVVAGPMGPEEGILYADLDLEVGIKMKLRHDFAGHYNRPDVFQVRVNASRPELYGRVESGGELWAGNGDPVGRELDSPAAGYVERARRAHELTEGD
jgi:aliphatic nitrilase